MNTESRRIGAIGWIGITATTAYAAAVIWFVDGKWSDVQDLKLNELGDFLAGAFGPLAILWLVLGFFQQGAELRQNRQALHIQAEELKNSVEQQALMVSVAEGQLQTARDSLAKQIELERQREIERIRQAQPVFRLHNTGYGSIASTINRHQISIKNLGSECGDVAISIDSLFLSDPLTKQFNHIKRMGVTVFELDVEKDYSEKAEFHISYIDALGITQKQIFGIEVTPTEITFSSPTKLQEFNR